MSPSRGGAAHSPRRPRTPAARPRSTLALLLATLVAALDGSSLADAQTPFPPPAPSPPPSFVFTFPPPSPPPATALDDFFRAAITRAYAFDRYTKETTGCYSWLSSGPSLGDSADRNLLLPPGKTWGEVAFTAYGITDADFYNSGSIPNGLDELVVTFELVAVPQGSNVTTDSIQIVTATGAVSNSSFFRVLPSTSSSASAVDTTSTPYAKYNRTTDAAFADDVLVTADTAGAVTAVITPDLPGSYHMLVTTIDACNRTDQAKFNVTAFCAHAPTPAVTSATSGNVPWDQAAAAGEVDDEHAFGWFPSHALDASATTLSDLMEDYYVTHAIEFNEYAYGDIVYAPPPPPPGAANDTLSPPPPPPPPPLILENNTALKDLPGWSEWTSAPAWNADFRAEDGLVYSWSLTGAPHGSQAWRTHFRAAGEEEVPTLTDASGNAYLNAVAPSDGRVPSVADPTNFLASFQPDVVGTYAFRVDVRRVLLALVPVQYDRVRAVNADPRGLLFPASLSAHPSLSIPDLRDAFQLRLTSFDSTPTSVASHGMVALSNVCFSASLTFETSFTCNAPPMPGLVATPRVNGNICLPKMRVESTASDAGGDRVYVSWKNAVAAASADVFFEDGTPSGAPAASAGLFLDALSGDVTEFSPDVQGEYAVSQYVTDGCVATSETHVVRTAWTEECLSLATAAGTMLTLFPSLALFAALVFIARWALRTPAHPFNPLSVRSEAARLRRWEAYKMKVKFERLADSWRVKKTRDAIGAALDDGDGGGDDERKPLTPPAKRAGSGAGSSSGKYTVGAPDRAQGPAASGEEGKGKRGSKRRRSVGARAAAKAERAFAAALVAAGAATEEGAELVPASAHAWRFGRAVGIAWEGVTLASLAFTRNTWWGPAGVAAGRALGLMFDDGRAYSYAYFSFGLLVAAVATSQMAKPRKGERPPATQRALRFTISWIRGAMYARSKEGRYAARKARMRVKYGAPPAPTGPGGVKAGAAASRPSVAPPSKPKSWANRRNLARSRSGKVIGEGNKGPLAKPLPAWAVSAGGRWTADDDAARDAAARRAAAAVAARERAARRPKTKTSAVKHFAASTPREILRACVAVAHFVGSWHVFLSYLLAEPLFTPTIAAGVSMLTCNHLDAHRPYPHLARDDAFVCYGDEHAPLIFIGVVTVVVTPFLCAWFLTRVAPTQDLTSRELPHFACARVALRWFAAAIAIGVGETDLTRVTPRGEYGVPDGEHPGFPTDQHKNYDTLHLLSLCACVAALYCLNFRFQPTRGKGGTINCARAAAYAGALWAAFMGLIVTCASAPPASADEDKTGDFVVLWLFLPAWCYLAWKHNAARGRLFSYPDASPRVMRKSEDPRVRAMGILAGDASDGVVGFLGHWEGLERQREASRARAKDLDAVENDAAGAGAVDFTPGVGLASLTSEAEDEVAEDALMWQLVMQVHFAGFPVHVNVRKHFAEAVDALSRSKKGTMAIQRNCLTPLLKRLLLDPESSLVRVTAANAVASLTATTRGVSLLCADDHDAFLACRRQREREWYQALIFLEKRYSRAALRCDRARASYLTGFWQQYANKFLPPDRFTPLIDWNIMPWLDDDDANAIGDGALMGGGASGVAWMTRRERKAYKKASKKRRFAAKKARNRPEVSVPEALAKLLDDREDVVVVAAIRAIGAALDGLRRSDGRKMPADGEEMTLLDAKQTAGPLYRLALIRKLPAEFPDDDEMLEKAAAIRKKHLARKSGDSDYTTSSMAGSDDDDDDDDGDDDGERKKEDRGKDAARGGGGDGGSTPTGSRFTASDTEGSGTESEDDFGGLYGNMFNREPSPMDFVLDAPGVLSGLVLCTAHRSPTVRSAAHEELVRMATDDDVATTAKRIMELLENVSDSRVRVKSLEFIKTLVFARLKELTDAAAENGGAHFGGRAGYVEDDPLFSNQRATADHLGRESVDLVVGVESAPRETPCVTALLAQEGVFVVAACLDDRDSALARVTALQLLRAMWETLAADEGNVADVATEGRLALFRECGVLVRLERLRDESGDRATIEAVDALAQRILESDANAAHEMGVLRDARSEGFSVETRKDEFLEAKRARAAREASRASDRASSRSKSPRSPANGRGSPTGSFGLLEPSGSGGDGDATYRSGDTYTERASMFETTTTPGRRRTPRGDVSERSIGSDRYVPSHLDGSSRKGGGASTRRDAETEDYAAKRWDEYVKAKAPPTARFMRAKPDADLTGRARESEARERHRARPIGTKASDGLGRWAGLVASKRPAVATRTASAKPSGAAAAAAAADGGGDAAARSRGSSESGRGDLGSARGSEGRGRDPSREVLERRGAFVRARMPIRPSPAHVAAGAPKPVSRRARGEPSGPGPDRAPSRPPRASCAAVDASAGRRGEEEEVDARRSTWRERASEYILAGGGGGRRRGGGGGGGRRGPHERGVLRDGRVGLAGQPSRATEGPEDMFPSYGGRRGAFESRPGRMDDGDDDGAAALPGALRSMSGDSASERNYR